VAEKLISRQLSQALNLPEKDAELLDMMRSINWRNPASEEQRYLFAAEIVRQAEDLVTLVDPTPILLEQKTYEANVTNIKFKDVVGFEARTVTSGGHKEAIRIDNEIVSLPIPRRYDHVTIEMLTDDIEEGTYDDIAGIREGIAEALLRKKINTVWSACNDAITRSDVTGGSGNDNLIMLSGGALTEAALDYAIDYVDAEGGGVYSILGHPTKVNPISKFTTFQTIMPETQKLDYWRTGFIGLYRGASVIRLPSVVDKKYGIAPTDANSVFVLGAGLGEIAQIKGVRASTWPDESRNIQYISAEQKYVVLTWQPKGAFRLQLYA
jgi:hypothetical protein